MSDSSENGDLDNLLDCALAHKADTLRRFLDDEGLPTSGTRDALRARLQEFAEGDAGRIARLTNYLDLIEGWGNQHLYLYKAPAGLCRAWRSEQYGKGIFKTNRVLDLANGSRPTVLPARPTLSSIRYDSKVLRLVWTEKREWFERVEEKDSEKEEGRLVFKAFERRSSRGTLAFDWDLTTGDAMIMIQRLPSGTNYERVRDRVVNWLRPFVDIRTFEVVRVNTAIRPIRNGSEVRERKVNLETIQGGKASFTSPGKRHSVKADQTLRKMEAAGDRDVQGSFGNFYWLPANTNQLDEEMHTTLHKKDQRVGVFGEKLETEVRYVVRRVRAHCG
jgi:hypothetical protein